MISYIKGMLEDPDGSPSSKRFIILLCCFLLSLGFVSNLFWGFKVEQYMFDAIMWIVLGGAGISGIEKFVPKKP